MNILMITTTLPHRRTNGGEIATRSLMEAMERCGHRVELLGYNRMGDPQADQPHYHSACDWVIETDLARGQQWRWLADSLRLGLPYVMAKFRSKQMRDAAERLCREIPFDLVIYDHLQLGWLIGSPFLPRRTIGIAHNVEHELLETQAADTRNGKVKRAIFARDARLMRAKEANMARHLGQIWTLTPDEQNCFMRLSGRGEDAIRVIPLPGQTFPPPVLMPEATTDIVILGAWVWDVNRQGLVWFMSEVAPLLPPDISVAIGGKGSEQVPNDLPNIRYAGIVPDAADFLRSGKVICIPSVMGAGIQLKSIEGIGIGRPVVTTPLGLRGIGEVPDHVHVAGDARALADQLVALAREPASDHRVQALRWAAERRDRFDGAIQEALSALG